MQIIAHFKTITRHKILVARHCFRCGLYRQGLTHDLSKYGFYEFWRGAKYYQGFCSPNVKERELFGYSAAWLHHKGRNRHHFEYWSDFNQQQQAYVPVEMPQKYLLEMFCDRVAASKVYCGADYQDQAPWEYYCKESKHMQMHAHTEEQLVLLLKMLADEGEEAVFNYIRRMRKGKG